MDCCNILETLTNQSLLVKEYKYWNLYLRSRTKTLGTSALVTKQHYNTMSEIPQEAITELSQITKELETVFNKLFKPDKYNYQMNMMKENHTHFNIFPRYSSPREYLNITWTDNGWPALVGDNLEINQEVLIALTEEIKKEISHLE